MRPTDDESPARALLVALAAMGGVAVLVGLAVGLVVTSVMGFAGLDEGEEAAQEAPQSLHLPKYSPTGKLRDELGLPARSRTPTPKVDVGREAPAPSRRRITLFMAPQRVAPGERINVNGVYGGGEGAALQIQRRDGGAWTDFPVTATVRGGTFATWILTSRTGRSEFRVYDPGADRASNVVVVTIG